MRLAFLALFTVLSACTSNRLSPEQIDTASTPQLCEAAGTSYAINEAQQFHAILTEIRSRGEFSADCVTLASIGFNAEVERRRRSQVMGQAFAQGMNSMGDAFKRNAEMYQRQQSLNCTTTDYGSGTSNTTCR